MILISDATNGPSLPPNGYANRPATTDGPSKKLRTDGAG